MKVSSDVPKAEKPDVDITLSQSPKSEKTTNADDYFNPKDRVDISNEARELQARADVRLVKTPEKIETAQRTEQSDQNRLNLIASKIMQGQNVSPSEERTLKESNPQLYARAKAKAKLVG